MIKKGLNIILFLFYTISVSGQVLNTVFDKDKIEIGEPIRLTFSVILTNSNDSVVYVPHAGSFNGKSDTGEMVELEILSAFRDTILVVDNQTIWKGWYSLTCWDSTFVTVLPEQVKIGEDTLTFPATLLAVTMPPANANIPLYDIHEVFTEVSKSNTKQIWWILLVVLIVILIILFYIFKHKRKNVIGDKISLLDYTIKKIDELEKSKYYETHLKEYYAELSIIFRTFIGKQLGIRTLDKTSNEIVLLLKTKKLGDSVLLKINLILSKSDMVKFAKSTPPIAEVFEITEEARKLVKEITIKSAIEK